MVRRLKSRNWCRCRYRPRAGAACIKSTAAPETWLMEKLVAPEIAVMSGLQRPLSIVGPTLLPYCDGGA